jgi:hypothetical protein
MLQRATFLRAGACLALALAGAACGADAPEVEELTPQEVLNLSADRMAEVLSFAFLMEHENGFTPIMNGLSMERAEGWISEGNRMQADIRARAGGSLAIDMGIVAVPDSAWMTNPFTRAWEPGTFDVSALFDPATGITALLRGLTDPQIIGVESVNGVDAQRIDATVDSGILTPLLPGAGEGTSLAVRVWIGVEDPVLHRAEIVGAIGEGESVDLLRRITLSLRECRVGGLA